MKYIKIFFLLVFILIPFSFSVQATQPGDALWAKSTVNGNSSSRFSSVTADSNGNSFAAGYINGSNTLDFGNGVTVSGPYASDNMLLVKFDSNGTPIWARSMISGPNYSYLNGVATDSNGNVYIVGTMASNGTYNLGNGVTFSGAATYPSTNLFIAKYDTSGNALWAKSTSSGSSISTLYSVAIDSSGNAYTAGYMQGNGAYGFGDSITATGSSNSENIILIKYDTNGTTKWAKTVSESVGDSAFYSVALDNAGNPHVAGKISWTSAFNFGNGVSLTGINSGNNIVIVKYDSNGNAGWAKTMTSAPNSSQLKALVLDNDNNVFGGGSVGGAGSYDFGDGVNATALYSGNNALLAKYNSTGHTQWAKFPTTAPSSSDFNGAAIDNNGNIYMGGYIYGTNQYNFGNNVTVSGIDNSYNLVWVSCDSKGNTIQAKSVVNGTDSSMFNDAYINSIGDLYTGGYVSGNNYFDFGNNITVNGSSSAGTNSFIVKYLGDPTNSSSYPSSSSSSSINNNSSSSSINNNCSSSSSSSRHPNASSSSSSSSNPSVVSDASSMKHRLPQLFAVGGTIMLLFF